ncbi:TrbC/VirB2 family protein [Hydrogenophaga pseudoflava]|uniref:Type IV secretion system protein virB2 n=1 Tax=Hydrogenophaga pseudoflava TaxID=47421 RepID=A0A4P6X3F0_HYDPS|nr:TrbC/VirB2 family protein [Hydrogenophaga pseudoflava]QBM30640.1 Type IV secretion system protein virB2 precursor [Hydrogenophaga pseudoflava]
MTSHTTIPRSGAFALAALVGLAFLVSPEAAFAQAQVNTVLSRVVTMLTGAGVLILTVAIIWVGYKMIFAGARFSDVAHILIGGILIGGAATFASWLLGS